MTDVREVPIYQSCNRPNLLAGCDREMLMLSGLLSAALVFSVATIWAVGIGLASWLAALAALTRMGKIDPMLRHVYLRHIRYQPYYPAKSGVHAEPVRVAKAWR
jgi:type IV secretion system protein TrbD